MKKFIKTIIIILIIIAIIATFYTVSKGAKKTEQDINKKIVSEIKYLDSELTEMLNSLNGIQLSNFETIIVKQQEDNNNNSDDNESNQSKNNESENGKGSSNSKEDSSEGGSSSQESGSSGSSKSGGGTSSEEKSENYELEKKTILSRNTDVQWDEIRQKIESLYLVWPTITMDLYKINIQNNDILGFSDSLDYTTLYIKEENKGDTLKMLVKLYEYLSIYNNKASNDELYKNIIDFKKYILNAYVLVSDKSWNEINENLRMAEEIYNKILNDTSIQSEKKFNINQTYIVFKELQNSCKLQDEDVFYIKYKNLLLELNNF